MKSACAAATGLPSQDGEEEGEEMDVLTAIFAVTNCT
jgi:hypothetical protein